METRLLTADDASVCGSCESMPGDRCIDEKYMIFQVKPSYTQ
jgi:hypothetical protein